MSKTKKMNKRKLKKITSIISVIILVIIGYFAAPIINEAENLYNSIDDIEKEEKVTFSTSDTIENIDLNNEKLNIVFFYVGQADCTFVKLKDECMIIDAGNNEDGKNIVNYLKNVGITKIDYVVGTHADEDHIGGLDDVIDGFDIGTIYMPKVGDDATNYKNVAKAAKKKNLQITNPKVGEKFNIGTANLEVLSVMEQKGTSDNNSSIVIQMNYDKTKYLFMGDAEKEVENSRTWENVDVLKVGHHGSATSSTQNFLDQVKPHYAVVEVGKNNSYRLPNKNTIDRLETMGITVLRTDINTSSFWITSDGKSIEEREVKINLDGNKSK